MKLCEHLAPLYGNEMQHGNRPLFVSTPDLAQKYPHPPLAEIYVNMQNKLLDYELEGIQCGIRNDCHYPSERYFYCAKCRHYISGPVENDQKSRYEHSKFSIPNDKIVATKDNIYIEDGFFGMFVVPVERV